MALDYIQARGVSLGAWRLVPVLAYPAALLPPILFIIIARPDSLTVPGE